MINNLKKTFKLILVMSFLFSILLVYNNCGRREWAPLSLQSLSSTSSSFASGVANTAPAYCASDLSEVYAITYHPFLTKNCNSCHGDSHGSTNLGISFQAFTSKGETLINYQATHAHGGNNYGAEMQTTINSFYPQWKAATNIYSKCIAGSATSGNSQFKSVATIGKSVSAMNANTYVDLVFDLDTEVANLNNKIPATLRIKVKYLTYNGMTTGFLFKDPSIQLKTTAVGTYQFGDLHFVIENQAQDFVTTYIDTLISVSDTILAPIALGYGSAIAYYTAPSASTKIAIDIRKVSPIK